jgi:acyl carrier protein
MHEKIKAIMAEILDVEVTDIGNDFNPESADNWDSLNNLHLITGLEEEFGITLTMSEIQGMVNFSEIVRVVESHSH